MVDYSGFKIYIEISQRKAAHETDSFDTLLSDLKRKIC